MMIKYFSEKNRDTFNTPATLQDIEAFIKAVASCINHARVEVELQPGDATSYRWDLVYTFGDRHLIIFEVNKDSCQLITALTDPWKMDANPWTACLMCEIYQRLFVGDKKRTKYYDFKRCCPVKDGKSIR